MHREAGTLVDLNLPRNRAVGKMKTTITQRFNLDGVCFDIDCDNTFIFFCLRKDEEWKAKYYKVFYAKDKVVPVNGFSVPKFSNDELNKYPEGYRYLGAAQAKLGHMIDMALPTFRNEYFSKMYEAIEDWLDGKEIDLFWEKD
jgi:hypothetical protein